MTLRPRLALLFYPALLLCLALPLSARAETITIDRVEAGPVLLTTNGQRVRLDGLRTPDEASILTELQTRLHGQNFTVTDSTITNRWSERIVQLQPDIRTELLALGLAQLEQEEASLSAYEAEGMRAEKGLWALECCRLLNADEAAHHHDEWRIVEGRVHKVSAVGRTVYVNFAEEWRKDFTLSLTPALARRIHADSWAGQTLLVRGWLTLRGGGLIAVSSAKQISLQRQEKQD